MSFMKRFYRFLIVSLLFMNEIIKKSLARNFYFWHFSPIFVLLKLPCLVTLFDRKL